MTTTTVRNRQRRLGTGQGGLAESVLMRFRGPREHGAYVVRLLIFASSAAIVCSCGSSGAENGSMSNTGGGNGGSADSGAVDTGGTGGDDGGSADSGAADMDGGTQPSWGWVTLAGLAEARQNAGATEIGGVMYVLGGRNESGFLASVERYDPVQASWSAAPPLPNPQCCAAVAAIGDTIAMAGGYATDSVTPTDALLLFDPRSGVWQQGPPLPTARVNAMAVAWGGKLAVIGGSTGSPREPTGVIELYDPVARAWSTSTQRITPREGGVAVTDGSSIYVIGGAVKNSLYGDSMVEIVSATETTTAPSLNLGRVQIAGGFLAGAVVIAGGWTAAASTATAEGLFGTSSTWQKLPEMPTHRAGPVAAVLGNRLIVAGGGQYRGGGQFDFQTTVEALEAR
jgi:serine/threonine-protein kinase PknK